MLKSAKKDWFSIVATDLFCNVLCAVIILDAVSPKETVSAAYPALLEVSSNKQADGSCPDGRSLVLAFDVISGKRHSTLEAAPIPVDGGESKCRFKYLFSALNLQRGVLHARLIVAQFNGEVSAGFTVNGGTYTVCDAKSKTCPLEDS